MSDDRPQDDPPTPAESAEGAPSSKATSPEATRAAADSPAADAPAADAPAADAPAADASVGAPVDGAPHEATEVGRVVPDAAPDSKPSPKPAEAPPIAAPGPSPLLLALAVLIVAAVVGVFFARGGGDEALPGDAKALLAEGRRLGKEDLTKALPYFQKAASLAPEDLEVQVALGRALDFLRRSKEAIPVLARAVKLDPKRADLLELLGKSLTLEDRHKEARVHLEAALELAPNSPEPLYYLGVGAMRVEDHKRVAEIFGRYVKSSKNQQRVGLALRILADARDRLGDQAGAIKALETLVAMAPGDVNAQRGLQGVRLEVNGYEPTLKAAAAAVTSNAHPIEAFLYANLLAAHPDHVAKAGDAYVQAIKLAPREFPARLERVRWLVKVGQLDEAQQEIVALPPHHDLILAHAEIERAKGRYDQARRSFSRLLEIQKNVPAAQIGMIGVLLDQKKGEEALAYVRSLFAFAEPGDPRHQLEAGALQTLGRFDEADKIFLRLIEKGRPGDKPLWLGQRVYLLLDADRVAEARKVVDELLVLSKKAKVPPPVELALWGGAAFHESDRAKAEELWETGADRPIYGVSGWRALACRRLLGRDTSERLARSGDVGGAAARVQIAYFEGLALQREGKGAEARAAWKQGLELARGDEFPARLLRRALGD